ncbi:hypothetical protein [Burkholderia cenocepacia]|uniref:hypothetical protein n=1 Tax=Burkholderia cenocepacia TaxID=95486 RepID=UPI0013E08000|nr:hypothetical protein [Burkholderia cenocepacia]MCW3587407.1 hypothetical protein [Burkholderia cenocepacia]MCW3632611.1 hypothetical protein [Burkholderia cenocepacia]MCW5181842.1 hypothetical protein [Burkholderia cenocepacia]NGO98028.1 hypothetical protein [Burkholderia cenocepacia]
MASKQSRTTEGVTVRMDAEWKRTFVEVAAEESLKRGESRTAQDVMRDWLSHHPAIVARFGEPGAK